ncbi:hypothetical protein [Dyella nitratireducens]|uniref:Uncharacterized protein n=1 Tax=Dyella nitratireducens TaxID=1849580 RepID=A0ABQ1GC14_9GAMM|nr:hypothetical protein [Dyella nitratireducens]GGA40770.1 hypothetical protein GCM10010981_32480 [Dyella nitratireducens]GLQ40606.1 hypothetical protein GCM10007902_04550 [Dyella nitratireducens]
MSSYKFAHLREQGQDMIVVPLDSSFGSQSSADQHAFIDAFQAQTRVAQLAGTVVAIWRSGNQVSFIAPRPWHGFFQSPGIWNLILANLNKELTI